MNRIFCLALVSFFAATSASFAAEKVTATLATPVPAKKQVIVRGNIFECENTTCNIVSTPVDPNSIYTCRTLVKKVGPVTAYGPVDKPFDAKRIDVCNAK